jgi:carbon storage regulator
MPGAVSQFAATPKTARPATACRLRKGINAQSIATNSKTSHLNSASRDDCTQSIFSVQLPFKTGLSGPQHKNRRFAQNRKDILGLCFPGACERLSSPIGFSLRNAMSSPRLKAFESRVVGELVGRQISKCRQANQTKEVNMLVLSRKVGERIWIGENISVTVVRITGGGVRIGIEAPTELAVVREELKHKMENGEHSQIESHPAQPDDPRSTLKFRTN